MSRHPSLLITRHDAAQAQELRRQRRILLGMSIALATVMALTLTAPFWAALYICSTQGCL